MTQADTVTRGWGEHTHNWSHLPRWGCGQLVFSLLCCAAVLLISRNDPDILVQNTHPTVLHRDKGGKMSYSELSARLEALPTDDDLEEIKTEIAQAVAELAAQLDGALRTSTMCSSSTAAAAAGEPRMESTLLAGKTKVQWAKFVASRGIGNPPRDVKYCLWQCEDDECCPGGYRTADHFQVILDNMQQFDADDGVSDITLVTQGTANRIEMFNAQAERWPGPKVIVFAVYNHTSEMHATASSELAQIREASRSWTNVRVLSFIITHIGPAQDAYSQKMVDPKLTLYPINSLRNMVADQARTNWVFPADVDFIPSKHLYRRMISVILPRLVNVERVALVVPHFEFREDFKLHTETPGDFAALDFALQRGKIVPFHSDPKLVLPGVETASDYVSLMPLLVDE